MASANLKKALPRLWLMTDERIGDDALIAAVRRLPRGAAVIFRHYSLAVKVRRALFERVRAAARRRGVMLVLAGNARQALAWRADGWHGPSAGRPARRMLHSAPAHDVIEMRAAERQNSDLLFISPVFPTRSHPDARILGRVRFGLLTIYARKPVIALGGMTKCRARSIMPFGIHGWAATDALS